MAVYGATVYAAATAVENLTIEELLLYLAANTRRIRQRQGITQEALAQATGFDLRYIQKIESGRQGMSLEGLVTVANALHVAPGMLLRPAIFREGKRGRPKKPKAAKNPSPRE